MSRNFKNKVLHKHGADPKERRDNLYKEVYQNGTPFPEELTYEDIDSEFKRWVDEDLSISVNGEKCPTVVMFSNQRFSEYMQAWQHTDEKRNILLNFKTITRENNPKQGSLLGESRNIPGDRDYVINKVKTVDANGKEYYRIFKMKQPYTIDINYKIGIFTNKYECLNEFNTIVNDKFKAINCYIRPNGHFIGMKLNEISDDSEYSLDNRQFYSQTYSITVKAYIINKNSFSEEEGQILKFKGVDYDLTSNNPSYADIEEFGPDKEMRHPIAITTSISHGVNRYQFTPDCSVKINDVKVENLASFVLAYDDTEIDYEVVNSKAYDSVYYDELGIIHEDKSKFHIIKIKKDTKVTIKKLKFKSEQKEAKLVFNGYKIID